MTSHAVAADDRDRQPLLGEVRHQVDEARALLAEEVRLRHPDVGEEQLGGVLRVLTDLLEVAAALEALHAALDDEQRDALVPGVRVGPGHHDDQVGEDAVGDEGLLAVEHVVVAGVDGARADALEVGPGARLAHRDRGDGLPRAQAGEPASPLLLRGARREVRDDHVVEQRERRPVDAAARQLLADDHVVAEVGRPAAAVLLVELEPEQALRAGLHPHLAVDDAVALPLVVERHDLLVEEGTDGLAERLVLLVEDRAGHAAIVTVGLSRCKAHPEG